MFVNTFRATVVYDNSELFAQCPSIKAWNGPNKKRLARTKVPFNLGGAGFLPERAGWYRSISKAREDGVLDVGQLWAVGMRPFHQGAGWTQSKNTCSAKGPVSHGGACFLPEAECLLWLSHWLPFQLIFSSFFIESAPIAIQSLSCHVCLLYVPSCIPCFPVGWIPLVKGHWANIC